MTKEQLLAKNINNIYVKDIKFLEPELESILTAMDEYAKQVVIDFSEWRDRNYYHMASGLYHLLPQGTDVNTDDLKAIPELFEEFLKQYNQ